MEDFSRDDPIVDLTSFQNESIAEFASILFRKKDSDLEKNISRFFLDEKMSVADLFCMLIDLLLIGVNLLYGEDIDIFMLENASHPIVETLKKYFRSCGFQLIVKEVESVHSPFIKIQREDNPSKYALIENQNYQLEGKKLENFISYFRSSTDKLFIIQFAYYLF
jgi:hypothetical protein